MFTQGNWYWKNPFNDNEDEHVFHNLRCKENEQSDLHILYTIGGVRSKADANLISASPDMHQELEITVFALESMLENTVIRGDYIPFLKERIKKIKKTLAKADGK